MFATHFKLVWNHTQVTMCWLLWKTRNTVTTHVLLKEVHAPCQGGLWTSGPPALTPLLVPPPHWSVLYRLRTVACRVQSCRKEYTVLATTPKVNTYELNKNYEWKSNICDWLMSMIIGYILVIIHHFCLPLTGYLLRLLQEVTIGVRILRSLTEFEKVLKAWRRDGENQRDVVWSRKEVWSCVSYFPCVGSRYTLMPKEWY